MWVIVPARGSNGNLRWSTEISLATNNASCRQTPLTHALNTSHAPRRIRGARWPHPELEQRQRPKFESVPLNVIFQFGLGTILIADQMNA